MRRAGWVLACAALVACGAPQNHYVAEKPGSAPAGSVYFAVPHAWTEFPPSAISAAQSDWSTDPAMKSVLDATLWQQAFDAAPQPALTHVLGRAASDAPTVYASLRTVYGGETVTDTSLRDLVLPLSTLGTKVTVLRDEKLTQGGARGIHLVVSYAAAPGAPEETIDQTSYLSDGKDAVYLLVVRCTTACYDANADLIGSVTSSYTIQGDSSG